MNYGQRVRHERERRGWTRDQLAEKINASAGTVKNLENAKTAPVGSKFTAGISDVLGVRTSDIDPTDPPVSQASDMALLTEVARRFARSQQVNDTAEGVHIDVQDVPLGNQVARQRDTP